MHACIPQLREVLGRGHAVLSAEPGSGKTTLVPLLLLDEAWLAGKKILMLEPRRPAARMAARRMADLLQESVGDTVGYQVRFDRRISADTRIEVLTEGLLLRRLQSDPELTGIGLVIFDEFHERNLYGDLSLALCLDVCKGLREDLRLLAMSASLDAEPLARLMQATPVSAAGRCHAVDIHYADQDSEQHQSVAACVRALGQALAACKGDVLVFLPGRREIELLCAEAQSRWGDDIDALTLYGDMPAAAQDAVLRGAGKRRRVIAATDIAETSLTIEGVEAVVDSGLARKPRFDPNTGLTRLETRWISRASALQRAGRAGRLGPGQCFRAWTPARQARLDDWSPAEIVEAELSGLVLELANWGVNSVDALRWLDPPPQAHWDQATELLRQLGALDARGRIQPVGRDMVRFPAHPRLAHLLAVAGDATAQGLAADMAAVLSERDPLRRQPGGHTPADIELRLDALDTLRAKGRLAPGIDRGALQRIDKSAAQLRRLCAKTGAGPSSASSPADCGALLTNAYPERVARCTSSDGRRYLMRNGRAVMLDVADSLCGAPFLAVANVDAGRRDGRVWLAAALSEAAFDARFAGKILVTREVRWDEKLGDVVARRVRRLDALLLQDDPDRLRADDPVADVLVEQVRSRGLAVLFDDPVDLRARVESLRSVDAAQGWPDFSEAGLLASAHQWLPSWLKPGQGIRQLRALNLRDILMAMLGWERQQLLDRLMPTHFDTPAGTRRRIDYSLDADPVLALPLQEMLGRSEGPVLAQGRVTPVLHLLSPAGRPLQVTRDLGGFWRGAYDDVKKEMRGRYPKHFWPDDPADAKATRFTKRRMDK